MSTTKTSIEPAEARARIESLAAVFELAHRYARVQRMTRMTDGQNETDGEHAISLAMIAMAYAQKYHPELDAYKVFFYGVMHDIDEFLHGDTPTLQADAALFAKKEAEEAQAKAVRAEILQDFPALNAMIDGLEDVTVPENAFTKAFDKLAPGYTHSANSGAVLKEVYSIHDLAGIIDATQLTDKKMAQYAADFPDVLEMRRQMHRKVADDAFKST